jgi:hypothetical protein
MDWQETASRKASCRGGLRARIFMRQRLGPPTNMHIRVKVSAIQDQRVVLQEGIEAGPGEERLGYLPAGHIFDLGFSVVCEADYESHPVDVAGPQAVEAGISQVRQQATAPPGLINGQRPAVMLRGRAEMVVDRGPAAEGEDCMHLGHIDPRV